MVNQPSDHEILWRQYALYADLYKFYIHIVIKYNVLHFGIAGAILSFYFTRPDIGLAKWSVALPLVMSVGACGVLLYAASLLPIFREDMFAIRDKLELDSAPDFQIVAIIFCVFGAIHAATAVALTALLALSP